MARTPTVRWHAMAGAWTSAVGEVGKNGRRKPVYFRSIPYGPPGSANHERAAAALAEFLKARGRGPRRLADDRLRLASDPKAIEVVLRVARRYGRLCPARLRQDVTQEALLGLVYAARDFDPSRGVPFAGWAGYRAKCQVRSFLAGEPFLLYSIDLETADGFRLADVITDDHRPFRMA